MKHVQERDLVNTFALTGLYDSRPPQCNVNEHVY